MSELDLTPGTDKEEMEIDQSEDEAKEILGGVVFAQSESDGEIYRMGTGYAIQEGKLAENKVVTEYELADYGGRSALEMIHPKFIYGVKAGMDGEIAN